MPPVPVPVPVPVLFDLNRDPSEYPSLGLNAIGIGSSLLPGNVINLNVDGGLRHIVQRDGLAFEREVRLAQDLVVDPQKFFDHPLDVIFGVENGSGNFTDFEIVSSADEKKKHVLMQLQSFLQGLTGTRAIRDEALLVADELYTNSSKNSTPLVGEVDQQDVRPGQIRFVARSDGRRLILGCIDSFGELEITMMTKRIQKCFLDGVARSITSGTGGAGIGSFLVFNAAASLYVGVQKGRKTVVLCGLPLSMKLKETVVIPKNLHTVQIGG